LIPRRMSIEDFNTDWRRYTYDWFRRSKVVVEVPSTGNIRSRVNGFQGEEVLSVSTPLLSLMEKLGYVEKELLKEIIDFSALDYDIARNLLDLNYDFTYKYLVVRDFPEWVDVLQYITLMSPHERLSVIEQL